MVTLLHSFVAVRKHLRALRLGEGIGLRWAVLLSYVGLLTWLSLATGRVFAVVPGFVPFQDKVAHFFMYGVLVFLGCWALGAQWRPRFSWYLVLASAILYGFLMELLQSLVIAACRAFEFGGWLWNTWLPDRRNAWRTGKSDAGSAAGLGAGLW